MFFDKIRSVRKVIAAMICTLAISGTAALAFQTSTSSSPDKEDKENKTTAIQIQNEVTVTATRTESALRTLGQSISVITREEIEAQGAVTVHELLARVPGFSVAQTGAEGGATSLFVRGGESDFNLVMIDGVQINQPGGAVDLADLSTSNIERIEVVRGPSSVLYGADAVSATIHIITSQGASQPPRGHFSLQGGSFGTTLARGSISGGSERVQYALGGLYSSSNGFYDFNNEYDRGEASARFAFSLNDRSSIVATTRLNDSKYQFPTDFTGAIIDPNDFRNSSQQIHSIEYSNQFNTRFGARVQYGYHNRNFESFTVADGISDFFDSSFETDESRHYLDWQNNFKWHRSHLFTAGLSLEREESLTAALDRRSTGFYAQNQFSWNDRFFLTGGIRIDDNDRFENFVTGSLTAAFFPRDGLKLRASLGNGFRSPAFSEIVGFPEFGIVGNPGLRPEKNVAVDGGIDFLRGGLHLGATVFFNRFSDLIEFSFAGPPGTSNYQNVEAARSRGIEIEGSLPFGDNLRFGGHYTFLDTEVIDTGLSAGDNFVEGQELLRRPTHTAVLFGQYRKTRYRLRADLRFKGERSDIQFFPDFTSSRIRLESYWVSDLAITFPLVPFGRDSGDLALVLRGRNIFDRRYTEIAGFQSPGRSFTAGLEIEFR